MGSMVALCYLHLCDGKRGEESTLITENGGTMSKNVKPEATALLRLPLKIICCRCFAMKVS